MRKLTQQEYDKRDKSMTHYKVNASDVISWHDVANGWIPSDAVAIPDMEFDISEYEFSDLPPVAYEIDDGTIGFVILGSSHGDITVDINKLDVIAMAKHFKLTADDLK